MRLNKNKLLLLMAKNKLTIKELSIKAKICEQTYYKALEEKITPKQVGKIAEALGVEPEEIIIDIE